MEVIAVRSLALPGTGSSHVRKKEKRTQTDSSSKFIKISENLRAASHAQEKPSLILHIEVKRRFHLGNRDPEPILVLVGEGDAEVERTAG